MLVHEDPVPPPSIARRIGGRHPEVRVGLLFLLAIAAASLLGIATRPLGQLAAFWPANALLLGLLIRFPALRRRGAWIGATLGYWLADWLAGDAFLKSTLLTAGNLLGVGAGYWMLARLPRDVQRLSHPDAVLQFLLSIAAAAAAAGLVGLIANPLLFQAPPVAGWLFWFFAEAVNYLAFLPVVLTLPGTRPRLLDRRQWSGSWPAFGLFAPLAALLLSCALWQWGATPGAMTYPVPALLWCALVYPPFVSNLVTLGFSAWALMSISSGHLSFGGAMSASQPAQMSIRVAIAMLALAPVTVACISAAREQLLQRFRRMAERDGLSDLLNRQAFCEQAQQRLQSLQTTQEPCAVLMLDIDYFKRINDSWGHQAGDQVIQVFAQTGQQALRRDDLMGRLGGEEFALLLQRCTTEQALLIANRLRESFSAHRFDFGQHQQVSVTVSGGLAHSAAHGYSLDRLLAVADAALYRAKAAGRNRIDHTGLTTP